LEANNVVTRCLAQIADCITQETLGSTCRRNACQLFECSYEFMAAVIYKARQRELSAEEVDVARHSYNEVDVLQFHKRKIPAP
jgi:hypothetical protein